MADGMVWARRLVRVLAALTPETSARLRAWNLLVIFLSGRAFLHPHPIDPLGRLVGGWVRGELVPLELRQGILILIGLERGELEWRVSLDARIELALTERAFHA